MPSLISHLIYPLTYHDDKKSQTIFANSDIKESTALFHTVYPNPREGGDPEYLNAFLGGLPESRIIIHAKANLDAAEAWHIAASTAYLVAIKTGDLTLIIAALSWLVAAKMSLEAASFAMSVAVENTLAALSAYTAALNACNAAQAAAIAAQQALAECMAEED